MLEKHEWSKVIDTWPEVAKTAAKEIAAKYGAPDSACDALLIWENKGPYAWIRVNAMEVEHDFPVKHKDVLDIAVPYKVPIDKLTALAEFDGSATVMRTKGLLVAGCFKEGLDLLILNLSNDIIKNKTTPMEARMTFGKIAMDMMQGKMHPYLEALQFKLEPLSATQDPDMPLPMKM